MPTIEDNKTVWNNNCQWLNGGDEWSDKWGGTFMQWYGTIFPRIKAHLPANHILEIACGYGRWTEYLKEECKNLTVIDLSEKCIQACKERFSGISHIEYHVNDGKSLTMIPDSSVDFVFSFDSLVHADESVIESYISQFSRILSENGVAFIHHSNLGKYKNTYSRISRIPKLSGVLARLGILDKALHWRDFSVDAEKVKILTEKHGLKCISQEIIRWDTKRVFIDCMSTITRNNFPAVTANQIFKNPDFMKEAHNLYQLSQLYSPVRQERK